MTGRWTGIMHVAERQDDGTYRSVESHATHGAAIRALGWVQEHEIRCGRDPDRYRLLDRPVDWRAGKGD